VPARHRESARREGTALSDAATLAEARLATGAASTRSVATTALTAREPTDPWRWPAGRGAEVVATDIDPYFLQAETLAVVEVRRHDILEGPVEDAAFGLVVARAVLVHLRDRARALRHMAAGLKPGGWLVLVDPSPPPTPRLLRAADPALHERVFAAWASSSPGPGSATTPQPRH
jgi:SAM-dependent methyltransferase